MLPRFPAADQGAEGAGAGECGPSVTFARHIRDPGGRPPTAGVPRRSRGRVAPGCARRAGGAGSGHRGRSPRAGAVCPLRPSAGRRAPPRIRDQRKGGGRARRRGRGEPCRSRVERRSAAGAVVAVRQRGRWPRPSCVRGCESRLRLAWTPVAPARGAFGPENVRWRLCETGLGRRAARSALITSGGGFARRGLAGASRVRG
jgi:hypothetical protein